MADKDAPYRIAVSRTLWGGMVLAGLLILAGLLLAQKAAGLGGILILIATPALGVLVAGAGYARSGERRLAAVCAALLVLIACSAFLGTL